MDRAGLMALVVGFLFLLLALMVLGWFLRRRRQSSLGVPEPVPAALGTARLSQRLLYVATTIADEPLERVAVRGLGFRARAELAIHDAGVVLAIPGERAVFIPARALRGVGRATWTIDRVVEKDGLVLLGWELSAGDSAAPTALESYFRCETAADAATLISEVSRLLPVGAARSDRSDQGENN